MKRDMDFVRQLLLQVEDLDNPDSDALTPEGSDDAFEAKLKDHLIMLIDEAELLRGLRYDTMDGSFWHEIGLTWSGHEYLEKIRDPEIRLKTKAAGEKFGSLSVEVLGALAKGYLKKKIVDNTGIEIDL